MAQERVSRETIADRRRVATVAPYRDSDGQVRISNSADMEALRDALENIAALMIEDGPYGEEEDAALDRFRDAALGEIDRRLDDFVYDLENVVRPARRAKLSA